MKYIVIDSYRSGCGDEFTKEFNDFEQAKKEARRQWGYLTASEKAKRTICVIESVNPDEDAEGHFDGNPVFNPEVDA